MSIPLPEVAIGTPIRVGSLAVFPLFSTANGAVDYVLGSEALLAGTVVVEEIGEEGSVPELLVKNLGDHRVLFLEGEALIGAKQNRVLNTSVLVPAHAELRIPVSCVEQGRWRYTSQSFAPAHYGAPAKLRHALKSSVTQSALQMRGHGSDQGEVWREVKRQQDALACCSDTTAMSDTYEEYSFCIEETTEAVGYVTGASGIAVAIGPKLAMVELFDKPSTCEKVWRRLLAAVALDGVESGKNPSPVEEASIESLLSQVRVADWKKVDAVGEGDEFRAELDKNFGSALFCDGPLVHGSVVLAS